MIISFPDCTSNDRLGSPLQQLRQGSHKVGDNPGVEHNVGPEDDIGAKPNLVHLPVQVLHLVINFRRQVDGEVLLHVVEDPGVGVREYILLQAGEALQRKNSRHPGTSALIKKNIRICNIIYIYLRDMIQYP